MPDFSGSITRRNGMRGDSRQCDSVTAHSNMGWHGTTSASLPPSGGISSLWFPPAPRGPVRYTALEKREHGLVEQTPLTEWLRAAGNGDRQAGDRAYSEIYAELRRLAACQLGRNSALATLTPTALVNEAFLRLVRGHLDSINDRRHFFNLAARAMRQTVIDHARERSAEKRGGDLIRTDLDESAPDPRADVQQALALDQALNALECQDAELAEIFVWRLFGGLSVREIADLRGVTARTIQRDLGIARNYLRLALEPTS